MKRRLAHAMRRVARALIAKSNKLSPVDTLFVEAGQRAAQDYAADLAAYARRCNR